MGTRGLDIVRFPGRCYIRHHQYDSYLEELGVASTPTVLRSTRVRGRPSKKHTCTPQAENPAEWLDSMLATDAARARTVEERVCNQRRVRARSFTAPRVCGAPIGVAAARWLRRRDFPRHCLPRAAGLAADAAVPHHSNVALPRAHRQRPSNNTR